VVVDSVSFDLWYFQVPQNVAWDHVLMANIHALIAEAHPGTSKIASFTDVSVSYSDVTNKLHVYAVSANKSIYHTVRDSQNSLSIFDVVPD